MSQNDKNQGAASGVTPSARRVRPRRRLLAASWLLGLSGCLIPPRSVVITASGEVRAPDSITATRGAQYVEWTRAELQRRIPGLRDIKTDVWIQKRAYAGALIWMRVGSLHAFTLETPDLPNPRIHVPLETYRTSISHEMVHALLGDDWSTLPAIMEEGLCDAMSVELAEDPQLRLNLLVSATIGPFLQESGTRSKQPTDVLRLLRAKESLDLHKHGNDYAAHAYGLGYVLVDRLLARYGIESLHELCLRAAQQGYDLIPPEWILDAAQVRVDTDLAAQLSEAIDEALFQHLVQSGELLRLIHKLESSPGEPPWALDGILITYEADMLEGGGIRRRLVDLPGFRDWARENPEQLESARIH